MKISLLIISLFFFFQANLFAWKEAISLLSSYRDEISHLENMSSPSCLNQLTSTELTIRYFFIANQVKKNILALKSSNECSYDIIEEILNIYQKAHVEFIRNRFATNRENILARCGIENTKLIFTKYYFCNSEIQESFENKVTLLFHEAYFNTARWFCEMRKMETIISLLDP